MKIKGGIYIKHQIDKIDFNKLCQKLSLGNLLNRPQRVFGGLLHKMYKVETDINIYAVKVLNPEIMNRDTAMKNYINSEHIANIAYQNNIPAVPALSINNTFIHLIDKQYYMVFIWVNGKTMKPNTIDINKCKIIGRLLADIHKLNIHSNDEIKEQKSFEWNLYTDKLVNEELTDLFMRSIDKLYNLDKRANKALEILSSNIINSHRDLDQKNVLWNEFNNPIIIDWEAAGLINPTIELLEVALYWSGGDNLDKEAFSTVIKSYLDNGGNILDEFKIALDALVKGKLGWLDYNLRRSVGIDCNDEEERILGEKESFDTLISIHNYIKSIPVIMECIKEIKINLE